MAWPKMSYPLSKMRPTTAELQRLNQEAFNMTQGGPIMGYGNRGGNTGRSNKVYKQRLVNHVAFVLDGSSSMDIHAASVVKVVDAQTAYLARRSKEMDQETRVSVYVFADEVECLIYDTDVLRLPSIKDLYSPYGWTALLAATIKSQQDLAATGTLYGEHS